MNNTKIPNPIYNLIPFEDIYNKEIFTYLKYEKNKDEIFVWEVCFVNHCGREVIIYSLFNPMVVRPSSRNNGGEIIELNLSH
jgi:hypothetical protein